MFSEYYKNPKRIAQLVVVAMTGLVLLAYFARPRLPQLEMVTAKDIIPNLNATYPGDTSLADRVTKSYGLAMVIVQSPYSEGNVVALDTLRGWARHNFQRHPDFLRPVSLELPFENQNSLIQAVGYAIFAGPYFFLEEQVASILSLRIKSFMETNSYVSFRNSYFDLFGVDGDSAMLLSRYQNDRAKLAIEPVCWSLVWIGVLFVSLLWYCKRRDLPRHRRLQLILYRLWFFLALVYIILASQQNSISTLISSGTSIIIGLYLRHPFMVIDQGKRIKLIELSSGWIALSVWFSLSLVVTRLLTWLRGGTLSDPDAITLLICACTGDFIHDPAYIERYVSYAIIAVWTLVGIWTLTKLSSDDDSEIDDLDMANSDLVRQVDEL